MEFNKIYLSRFNTLPGKFAYQGYDHMLSIYPSIYIDFENKEKLGNSYGMHANIYKNLGNLEKSIESRPSEPKNNLTL